MAEQTLSASNGILAIGIVAAAMIVIVVKPANITTISSATSEAQAAPASSGGNPLTAILGFLGL
jgi:hypothetical protein